MATAYDYIAANRRRSALLVVVFTVVVVFLGWFIGRLLEAGPAGVVLAVIVAVGMSLGGYYGGEAIALSLSGAQGPMKKEDNAYLWNLVENLCLTVGLAMPKLYLLPDPSINAFATGRDPQHASIAVTAGALQQLENEELEGVLAHELSHIQNYDVRFMTLVAVLVGMVAILSDFAWRSMLWGGQRRSSSRGGGNAQGVFMLIGLVLLILAPIIGQLLKLAVSRKREFLADASAALITRYPEGLARALEKIQAAGGQPVQRTSTAIAHLYISNPLGISGKGFAKLFSTHPPISERVQALRTMA